MSSKWKCWFQSPDQEWTIVSSNNPLFVWKLIQWFLPCHANFKGTVSWIIYYDSDLKLSARVLFFGPRVISFKTHNTGPNTKHVIISTPITHVVAKLTTTVVNGSATYGNNPSTTMHLNKLRDVFDVSLLHIIVLIHTYNTSHRNFGCIQYCPCKEISLTPVGTLLQDKHYP